MKKIPFCEKSIHWVLHYRKYPRKQLQKLYRYGFIDDHTTESWNWTLQEANIIQKKGLEYWLNKTGGPYGFQYWTDKMNYNNNKK